MLDAVAVERNSPPAVVVGAAFSPVLDLLELFKCLVSGRVVDDQFDDHGRVLGPDLTATDPAVPGVPPRSELRD